MTTSTRPIASAFDPRVLEDAEWADCPIWVDLIDTYGHPFVENDGKEEAAASELAVAA